jgi:hypothetical protein
MGKRFLFISIKARVGFLFNTIFTMYEDRGRTPKGMPYFMQFTNQDFVVCPDYDKTIYYRVLKGQVYIPFYSHLRASSLIVVIFVGWGNSKAP